MSETRERHDLLAEPLLRLEDETGARHEVTLPGLLAAWSRGDRRELASLQAHQQHAWYSFCVQLAVLALARAEAGAPAEDEARWRELLLTCAAADNAGPEAFQLVVDDLRKPAFMQPPVPEGSLDALKHEHLTPSSELDVLVTAKNHDVKIQGIEQPSPEQWVFALVTLQTMQGFLGAGNYGIARMNGGFASRPCVAYAPGLGSADRFLRDVRSVLDARATLLDRCFGAKRRVGLVWCEPWDGKVSLGFDELDPSFIEVCRRVRLTRGASGQILARRGSSRAARILASDAQGNTGDPWTPVSSDGKALTLPEAGFTYDRVQSFFFGDWHHGAAGDLRAGEQVRYWLGQVLVRGQGKTGGYHERWVPVPPKARPFLSSKDARASLGHRAKMWVERAGAARLKVLKPAVLTYLQGAPEKLKFDDGRAEPTLRRFDRAIDQEFFELLFENADADSEVANAVFEHRLFELAQAELELAFRSMPTSIARRARAVAYAERVLRGAALHQLPSLKPPSGNAPIAPETGDPT